MKYEMNSLAKNRTWELVSKPPNQKIIDCKWLYKIKEGTSQEKKRRYKARVVAKGFIQREGIDFNEVFSPIVKYKTIRLILAFVAQFDWELEQMDVTTTFLHGELEEEIYMKQPPEFETKKEGQNLVCKLKKSLYGLR